MKLSVSIYNSSQFRGSCLHYYIVYFFIREGRFFPSPIELDENRRQIDRFFQLLTRDPWVNVLCLFLITGSSDLPIRLRSQRKVHPLKATSRESSKIHAWIVHSKTYVALLSSRLCFFFPSYALHEPTEMLGYSLSHI